MRINYNISSIIARNSLNNNDNRLSKSIQRLSSGFKINSAADDAAGLAISLKMNAQIRGLERANQNANDGLSVVNTADGAMAEMHDILQRLNELAIQSANGTNAKGDREQIQLEVDQLVAEIDRISETTEFNAQKLLDGSFAYKGYTNTENVKVKSYTDGVLVGKYIIDKLEYNKFEDTIMDYEAYINDSPTGDVKHQTSFAAKKADDIKAALITNANPDDGFRSFPEGAKVFLDEEDIIIKGENNFEIKLSVNDRREVANSGVGTTTNEENETTDTYRNIVVKNEDGSINYSITSLNIIRDDAGNIKSYNTGSETEGLRQLAIDLKDAFDADFPNKDISITSLDYDATTAEFTVKAKDANNAASTEVTHKFKVYIPLPNESKLSYDDYLNTLPQKVKDDPINKYLYQHTETLKTSYTIGETTPAGNDIDLSKSLVLDMTGIGAMSLQIGANEGQTVDVEIPALQAIHLGVDGLDITSEESATKAIDTITDAINQLSSIRAKIGAYANRIEHTITNLDTTTENMTAAYSRIMDVDMATEMTDFSTIQVLVQSSTSMLAQANERPQQVLQLLQR